MLVPEYPGVLCALGCAYADLRYDISQTVEKRLDLIPEAQLSQIVEQQIKQAHDQIVNSQVPVDEVRITHAADMAYTGQIHSIRVEIEKGWSPNQMQQAFNNAYSAQFGNTLKDIPIVIVHLRTIAVGLRTSSAEQKRTSTLSASSKLETQSRRPVYFGAWMDTPIYARSSLKPGTSLDGPAIIEQLDTTTVVEPDMTLKVDSFNNLLIRLK